MKNHCKKYLSLGLRYLKTDTIDKIKYSNRIIA